MERFDLDRRIGALGLSSRSENVLWARGIRTIDDLLKYSATDILNMNGAGEKTLEDIAEALWVYGLRLRRANI